MRLGVKQNGLGVLFSRAGAKICSRKSLERKSPLTIRQASRRKRAAWIS